MVDPTVVGYRFRPTDMEIVEKYLRPKNIDSDTSHVDRVMSTVNISNLDPKELRSQPGDQVWYFFGRKENKYNRGDRQVRKTKSGFWKKTGKPTEIKRKVGEKIVKIGEKWILTFHMSKNLDESKTKWVMHEYHLFSPNKLLKYTVCKVKCKGEASEISSSPPSKEIDNHSSITQMNNSGELSPGSEVGTSFECLQTQEIDNPQHLSAFITNMATDEWNNLGGFSTRSDMGTSVECPQSQDLENPLHLSDYLYMFEDMQLGDTMGTAISYILSDDDYDQGKVMYMQEDRNDHRPKKPITGVFTGSSSDDDSDSELISSTTSSIQTSSTCEGSFGSSDHLVDQITELQESRNSIIKYEKVKQTPGQETTIGGDELGQEKIKNKRGGFFYRITQRFIRKIQLCTSIK